MDLKDWQAETPATITTEELDQMIAEFSEAKAKYEAKKKEATDLYADVTRLQQLVLEGLEKANKDSYDVKGIGKASVKTMFSTKVPKDFESKKAMLEYFEKQGEDMYLTYVSVNSQSLNSFYRTMIDENPDFILPGVELPTASKTLQFRRKK